MTLERAVAAGIGWPLPEGCSEEELEAKLFGKQPVHSKAVRERPQPDWKSIHERLQQHCHLTLQLVWEEYRQAHPEGYRYSWFCERYQLGGKSLSNASTKVLRPRETGLPCCMRVAPELQREK